MQEPQLGTGHALLQAEPLLRDARGTLVLLSGDVPLLRAEHAASAGRHAREHAGGGDGPHRDRRRARRLRPHRPRRRARLRASSRTRTRRRRSGEIREINTGIYAFDLAPLFAALRADRLGERAGRVLPARSRRDLPRARADGRDGDGSTTRDEIRASTAGWSWRKWRAIVQTTKNDELMAAGVTHRGSGDDLHRSGRRRSAPTRSSIPACPSKGSTRIGAAARSTAGVAHRRLDDRRRRRRSTTTA